MRILSVRNKPEIKNAAIQYFQNAWPSVLPIIYEDCISHSIGAKHPLPQWYLLENGDDIIGCAGLISNDFISRGDLYPWICALFIEEKHRGNGYASLLMEKAKSDAIAAGFEDIYLSTQHVGYYEKHGFEYVGQGYHPWGEESRIYGLRLK
ncbi:GNAT family N-acetyltransferase [Flagellimonas sp. 2504JD4-2]